MDMTTGAVLYSKNANKAQYPASITKIMTTLLACENLDMNGKLVMSESAAFGITESNSSSIYAIPARNLPWTRYSWPLCSSRQTK